MTANRLAPHQRQADLDRAIALHRRGDLDAAEAIYRQWLASAPGDANAMQLLGLLCHQSERHAEAARWLEEAVRRAPPRAALLNNLGESYRALERGEEALRCYRAALTLDPRYPPAHFNLAVLLAQQGAYAEAEFHLRRVLAIDTGYAPAYRRYAELLLEQRRFPEVIALAHNAPSQPKADPELRRRVARAWQGVGEPENAVPILRELAAHQPDAAGLHVELAELLRFLSREEEAEVAYRRALELDPENADAWLGLGVVALTRGARAEAEGCARRAIEIDPGHGAARNLLAGLRRYRDEGEPDIVAAEEQLARPGVSPRRRAALHFALGKMYDDCGNYPRAFDHYREGNRAVPPANPYHPEEFTALVDHIIDAFTPDLPASPLPSARTTAPQPCFIVGMPRSGTTLVEQIIASHPEAGGRGELKLLHRELQAALPGVPYPDSITRLDPPALSALAAAYLDGLTQGASPQWGVICDKMPFNFRYLGLIHRLFPHGGIVHCRRNPFDTCLSNYFQQFEDGNPQAADLGHIGHYYAQYRRLMEHWRRVLLPGRIHEVDYERLVVAPEATVAELLDYLGLSWEPACLDFYRSSRPVRTASSGQVREALYDRSIGRWRNYAPFIAPLREALGDPAVDSPE